MKPKKGDYIRVISGVYNGQTGKIVDISKGIITFYHAVQLNDGIWRYFYEYEIKKITKQEFIANQI